MRVVGAHLLLPLARMPHRCPLVSGYALLGPYPIRSLTVTPCASELGRVLTLCALSDGDCLAWFRLLKSGAVLATAQYKHAYVSGQAYFISLLIFGCCILNFTGTKKPALAGLYPLYWLLALHAPREPGDANSHGGHKHAGLDQPLMSMLWPLLVPPGLRGTVIFNIPSLNSALIPSQSASAGSVSRRWK